MKARGAAACASVLAVCAGCASTVQLPRPQLGEVEKGALAGVVVRLERFEDARPTPELCQIGVRKVLAEQSVRDVVTSSVAQTLEELGCEVVMADQKSHVASDHGYDVTLQVRILKFEYDGNGTGILELQYRESSISARPSDWSVVLSGRHQYVWVGGEYIWTVAEPILRHALKACMTELGAHIKKTRFGGALTSQELSHARQRGSPALRKRPERGAGIEDAAFQGQADIVRLALEGGSPPGVDVLSKALAFSVQGAAVRMAGERTGPGPRSAERRRGALLEGSLQTAALLLRAGADPGTYRIADRPGSGPSEVKGQVVPGALGSGMTLLEYAEASGLPELVELLEHGPAAR